VNKFVNKWAGSRASNHSEDREPAFDLGFREWAARVSNPARRIKRHVNPGLAGIDSCSFVLVSAAIELKGTDIRVAWCGPRADRCGCVR
jgi:hypothetical protein